MKQLLVTLLFLCVAGVAQAQDVIVKKDGSTIVCRVVELNKSEIVYKKWGELNGSNYVMERSAASAINYENGKKVDLAEAENLYQPGNQNDGTQQYNDRALLAIDAQSHPKKKRTFKWNIKAGYSFDMLTGGDEFSGTSGVDASIGISKAIGQKGMFWGVDVGAMSYGGKFKHIDKENQSGICFNVSPHLGINCPITQNVFAAPYIGPVIGYASESRWTDFEEYSGVGTEWSPALGDRKIYYGVDMEADLFLGFKVGVEVFLSKSFYVDLHLVKSLTTTTSIDEFTKIYDEYEWTSPEYGWGTDESSYKSVDYYPFKIVLGIGFQF